MIEKLTFLDPLKLPDNVFQLIGSDWMLITAGSISDYNTMTASWGGLGVLWNTNVCFCFVRPTRHTFGFMEKSDKFTLSFFDESFREALNICGTISGRDYDKAKEAGLTPFKLSGNTVTFEEARMIIECKKIYFQDIVPDNFLLSSLNGFYPKKDYHRMFIGEIINIFIKK